MEISNEWCFSSASVDLNVPVNFHRIVLFQGERFFLLAALRTIHGRHSNLFANGIAVKCHSGISK